MVHRVIASIVVIGLGSASEGEAQFRRGMLAESTEIALHPHEPPAVLLPAGGVQVDVRNASRAPARIADRLGELLGRQLSDNDARLRTVAAGGGTVITVTVTEWNESRRSSTKYVSEQRQTGTRQVVDKNGNRKTEPVYEYGRNRPSVVISANAAIRLEVRRSAGGAVIADETARHVIQEEHLVEAGPPTREAVEDTLIDHVVRIGAGRISPGRADVRVPLARSDEVDRLNALALERRWSEWLTGLDALSPHRDPKRDAYRLHNLAVAHESLAYEATTIEDWQAHLGLATTLIDQASTKNPTEKYITDARARIARSADSYRQLAGLYARTGEASGPARPSVAAGQTTTPRGATAAGRVPAAATVAPTEAAAMSTQDVIDLRSAGLDDENLLAAIKEAKAVAFDLSPEGLKRLLAATVSNRVIAAMRGRNAK